MFPTGSTEPVTLSDGRVPVVESAQLSFHHRLEARSLTGKRSLRNHPIESHHAAGEFAGSPANASPQPHGK